MARSGRRRRRSAATAKTAAEWRGGGGAVRGQDDTSTALHDERLDAVVRRLAEGGARTVVDLGCGSGALLVRLLADPRFTRIAGLDQSAGALLTADRRLAALGEARAGRVSLHHGSLTTPDPWLAEIDAAVMVETLEHIPPDHLSRVERGVFVELHPRLVVVTTPNRDYNPVYGLTGAELRHPDHRFEWGRSKFRAWASGVASRCGYGVEVEAIGPTHGWLGSPTQMAVFRSTDGRRTGR